MLSLAWGGVHWLLFVVLAVLVCSVGKHSASIATKGKLTGYGILRPTESSSSQEFGKMEDFKFKSQQSSCCA